MKWNACLKPAAWLALGLFLLGSGLAVAPPGGKNLTAGAADPGGRFVVATYAGDEEQGRSVRALIRSLRTFGGAHRDCPVYVVLGNPERHPCGFLKTDGVELVPLVMGPAFREYPLAFKAFAAAQVERLVPKADTLVWMDPGVLVLSPPDALDLAGQHDAAVRPVTLSNTIGLPAGAPPDGYWAPIFRETGLGALPLLTVETLADGARIQPYYNCEVYAVRPGLGVCAEWARVLAGRLRDAEYQKTACTTFLKRLFLHQAVLSAVIQSRVRPDRLRELPVSSGYPFNQHARLPTSRRCTALNDLSVVIFDDAWQRDPNWMDSIEIREPLRGWLLDTYREYLQPGDVQNRPAGSSNTGIAATPARSGRTDPVTADSPGGPDYGPHPMGFELIQTADPARSPMRTSSSGWVSTFSCGRLCRPGRGVADAGKDGRGDRGAAQTPGVQSGPAADRPAPREPDQALMREVHP